MTRANTAATSRGSGTVGGWGATAMFAVVMCGAGVLSGCAGLATPSNASPTPQEAVHISPSSISFAAVAVGQKATQTATLTNTGSEPVMITQLALSSTEFSASGLATPLSIGPGQSAKFQVTYTGTTSGDSSGTLTAMTSHGSGSSKVKLRGSSGKTASQLSLSTTALNFGNVLVNGSSTQAVTLKNSGQTNIQVSQVGVTGGAFTTTGLAVPATILAGQSVALQAKFAPTAAGAVTGAITITSDAQTATSTIALNGTGVAATYTMSLSPTSVNFGNVSAGSSATQNVQLSNTGNSSVIVSPSSVSFGSVVSGNTNSQTVQVRNSGTANLAISQATVTGTGFSLSGLALPLTLAPGQSGNFNVQYAPQGAGNVTGAVSILSNAPNSPATVALSGTAVAASYTISVNPGSLG